MKILLPALVLASSSVYTSHAFTSTTQRINLKVSTVGRQSTVLSEATTTLDESPTETEDSSSEEEEVVNSLEFPPPLTKVQRVQRAAKFWSSAIPIVLSYYSKDAELRVKVRLYFVHIMCAYQCSYHMFISYIHIICSCHMFMS